jgi:hypothetical protein
MAADRTDRREACSHTPTGTRGWTRSEAIMGRRELIISALQFLLSRKLTAPSETGSACVRIPPDMGSEERVCIGGLHPKCGGLSGRSRVITTGVAGAATIASSLSE